jgi:hypothetical protein
MVGEPLFPVVLKDSSFHPRSESTHYILAQNGLFLVRDTPIFSASVPAEGVAGLQPHRSELVLHLPRLPVRLLERAMGFFRHAYERWQGEAILVLFYAPPRGDEPGRFHVDAPPQTIRGRRTWRGLFQADLRLDYGVCEKPSPEYLKLGTFHSHGYAGPTHSATDAHDELYESGLHITAGYVNTAFPDFEASFVVGRTRFRLPVDRVLPRFRTHRRPPRSWLSRITIVCDPYGARPRVWNGATWKERGDDDRHPAP